MHTTRSIITGTGSYVPPFIKTNADFAMNSFYTEDNVKIETDPLEVVRKFEKITGISERRYADVGLNSSDMGALAAELAIKDSGCDKETIDQIIVAHNFGNVLKHSIQTILKNDSTA